MDIINNNKHYTFYFGKEKVNYILYLKTIKIVNIYIMYSHFKLKLLIYVLYTSELYLLKFS